MNKSSSIFIFFSLFVALSESFPKMYLVETEGGSKKNNTKDVEPSGCIDHGSEKIFKDGEYASPNLNIKCVCNSNKTSVINEKKCNWHFNSKPCLASKCKKIKKPGFYASLERRIEWSRKRKEVLCDEKLESHVETSNCSNCSKDYCYEDCIEECKAESRSHLINLC